MNISSQVSLTPDERIFLSERFGTGNYSKTRCNFFLTNIMKQLRKSRKPLSEDYLFSYDVLGDFGLLWIQTPACKNSKAGLCTVCNYWNGNSVPGIIEQVIRKDIDFRGATTLLVNTCGSCLDPYELCVADQKKLLRWLNIISPRVIILETHVNTLTDNTIHMVHDLLPDKKVFFEVGIESISKDVLFYSLNKPGNISSFGKTLDIIHSNNAYCIANVLLGAPFLTREEQVADAVLTINFLFDIGIDYLVLFPVNIKPNTISELLYRHGMYERIRADMLIQVLEQLPKNKLHKIDISWYGERVEDEVIGPYYCPTCQHTLKSTIKLFNDSKTLEERKQLFTQMKEMTCTCEPKVKKITKMTYFERLNIGYGLISTFFQSGGDRHDKKENT